MKGCVTVRKGLSLGAGTYQTMGGRGQMDWGCWGAGSAPLPVLGLPPHCRPGNASDWGN